MYQNSEYLEAIKDKLERLNKASHGSPEPLQAMGRQQNDPDSVDPLQWMGQAGLDYMNSKNQNDVPNNRINS
jgi:hypothetical protein